ncbi:MAG: ATP-binding protein, partial [Acidimicrobiia bacterium]
MTEVSVLRAVPLFTELSNDDLERLAQRTTAVVLDSGEELFAEGDQGDTAFVIVRGALEITKRSGDRDVHLATRRPGEVIGEMALLQDAPRSATARAAEETELISIPRAEIDELLDTSSEAVRALFKVLLERWQATQVLLAQSERMAQLGTLSAGLAHELNNPAAAVNRSAGQLREAIDRLVTTTTAIEHSAGVEALRRRIADHPAGDRPDAVTRADMESEVEDRLMDAEVEDAWRVAPMVVEAGLTEFLDEILADPESEAMLSVLLADHEVQSLLYEVEEGTRRMSAIVRALMSYSYLDRGTVQQVDIKKGIEDTLLILRPKLAGIDVITEFHPDLPQIDARGSELNQVWTNIIDNAAYSISTSGTGGTVTIRAFPEADGVVVEIEDDGPGFAPEHRERAFDSFFTTKPPGAGTGLGLSITYGIVVDSHHGDMSIESEPGRTVFRVVLPTT